MYTYSVLNADGHTLLRGVASADNPFKLLLGLLSANEANCSLLLPNTSVVHTVGMQFALDLVFLDKNSICLRIDREVPPWRVACGPRGTRCVLETKTVSPPVFEGIHPGDRVQLVLEKRQ